MRNPLRVAIVLAGVLLALPAGAQAGTYVINECPSAESTNTPGPWVVFGGQDRPKVNCSGSGEYIGPIGPQLEASAEAGVEVTAPSEGSVTIKEAKIWWSVPKEASGADNFAFIATPTEVLEETTTPFEHQFTAVSYVMPSGTTKLSLVDYCSNDDFGTACVFGGETANLKLYGAQLTLTDSGSPSGSATGGELAGGGPVSGKQSLEYKAEDKGSGVLTAGLLIDGKSVSKKSFSTKCTYTNFAACPGTETGNLSYETKKATNGSHEVALKVTSAGGNTATMDAHKILIEN